VGGSAAAAGAGNVESERFLLPDTSRRLLPCPDTLSGSKLCASPAHSKPSPEQAGSPSHTAHRARGWADPRDGPCPSSAATHPRAAGGAALLLRLVSGSAVLAADPWLVPTGGTVPGSGAAAGPGWPGQSREAGSPAGCRRGYCSAGHFHRPPQHVRGSHAPAPRLMAFQAACSPLVSILGGSSSQSHVHGPAGSCGETQAQVSAPGSACSPGRRSAGCCSL